MFNTCVLTRNNIWSCYLLHSTNLVKLVVPHSGETFGIRNKHMENNMTSTLLYNWTCKSFTSLVAPKTACAKAQDVRRIFARNSTSKRCTRLSSVIFTRFALLLCVSKQLWSSGKEKGDEKVAEGNENLFHSIRTFGNPR